MTAKVLTPPEEYYDDSLAVFLAGGITGAPDWQAEFIRHLRVLPIQIFNPRCKVFEEQFDDVKHDAQVTWEYQRLRRSDIISFWFPKEALCMVTLYELGYALAETRHSCKKHLFIGVEPGYKKSRTVRVQTRLAFANTNSASIEIVDS